MVLTENTLDELLSYMEKSMNNLAKEAFTNLELGGEFNRVEKFLQNQFDVRFENLLIAKNSSIHHLESKMKNKVIQRKQKILEQIIKEYKN
ncbi:MAG: hypothetical protein ACE5DU_01675 [Nitrosopumilus sp.]